MALLSLACSLDRRSLAWSEVREGDGGRGPSVDSAGASSQAGRADDADDGDDGDGGGGGAAGAIAFAPTCVGEAGERRCAVAAGAFVLGPDGGVPAKVSSFELDELEVTVGRFREYAASFSGAPKAEAGAHPKVERSGWRREWNTLLPSSQEQLSASLHCNFDWQTWSDEPGDREDYPLTCASYYVAFAFCASNGGRLPTEAEWEFAAAGGVEQRPYPWGELEPSFELALFDASAIAPAGGHRTGMSRFGPLDLAGSAWEWTLDLYHPYPERCDDCAEVETGLDRVLRGGAFLSDAEELKVNHRYYADPQLALGEVGFRCAYSTAR
jgi:formylglycine-generating enzyme